MDSWEGEKVLILAYNSLITERNQTMKNPEMPHLRHDEHLCYLQNMGYLGSYLNDYKELIRNARFVCKNCGRSAAGEANLCEPEKI